MTLIHLLSSEQRPTNTQWHWNNLTQSQYGHILHGTGSNAEAISRIIETGSGLAFVPYYNVLGKSVKDTMQAIANNYHNLKLHVITRMRIEYVLAMRSWVSSQEITHVHSHPQALLQTQSGLTKHIPQAQTIPARSTAEGLEIILNPENSRKTIAAVTTPFQILGDERNQLSIVENFGPANNYTYFALLGIGKNEAQIPKFTSSQNHTIMNEQAIRFGVVTIPDRPGSLCEALGKLSAHGINIMCIMSFPQPDGTVVFTIAYNNVLIGELPLNHEENKGNLTHMQTSDNQKFSARLHIPRNTRGSLYEGLHSLQSLINLHAISSIGTSMDTVDFEIIFSLLPLTGSDNIQNQLNQVLANGNIGAQIIKPKNTEIDNILHNLH